MISPPVDRSAGKAGLQAWAQAAVIVLAGTWVFWPAVRGDWIWDDAIEVAENPLLRGSAGALERIWVAPDTPDYFPLKTTFQWMEWHLWGARPAGYHLANIGLHLLSALLFWRLLRKLFSLGGEPGRARLDESFAWSAWLGGLLFAIHPLVVESVAWISELKNTLSLPFLLMAMISYVEFDDARSRGNSAAGAGLRSIAWFLAAMLCKSSVAAFPFVLLLYAWWRRGRVAVADAVSSLPFFAISTALGLVTIWFQFHRTAAGGDLQLGGVWPRCAAAGLAMAFYVGKFIAPANLLPLYPRWQVDPPSAADLLPWVALFAAIGWFWTKRGSWGRHALLGLGFFVVNLGPVLGFVPMAWLEMSRVADHFAYVPMLGLVGLAAAGLGWLGRRRHSIFLGLGVGSATILLAAASHRYAGIFLNNEVFWSYALRGNPKAWTAGNNLGIALTKAGKPGEAVPVLERALLLKPEEAEAHYNLGVALADAGRLPEARAAYESALRLHPRFAKADNNLGSLLAGLGRSSEAMACFAEAIRIDPGFAEAHNNLGLALAGAKRLDEAVRQYSEALRLKPDYAEAHGNLGNALAASGRLREAIGEYEAALQIDPRLETARVNLGNAWILLRLQAGAAGSPR